LHLGAHSGITNSQFTNDQASSVASDQHFSEAISQEASQLFNYCSKVAYPLGPALPYWRLCYFFWL